MSHDYHDGLPGFHPDQLLKDGCAECERRAKDISLVIGHLDSQRLRHAWTRAALHGRSQLDNVSVAEAETLRALWALQVAFEPDGIPIGIWPGDCSAY